MDNGNALQNDDVQAATILAGFDKSPEAVAPQLYQFAYQKFRSIAQAVRAKTVGNIDGNTWLQISCNTTSLVHDAFVRVMQSNGASFSCSSEFYQLYSQVIYSVLIDHVRKSLAKKRQFSPVELSACDWNDTQRLFEIERLLKQLATEHSRQVAVFVYKYVCLSPSKEIAVMFNISESSVEKDLSFIKKTLSLHLNS